MPRTLDAIHRHVTHQQLRPAVTDERETISYRELWARASEVARLLRVRCTPGDFVAIAAERGTAFVTAALGCWLADTAYLPLDPAHPKPRLRGIVSDSGAPGVVVSPSYRGIGAELGVDELLLPTPGSFTPEDVPPPRTSPDACAYLLYTSGTTGAAKGVLVGHDSLANLIDWHLRAYHVTAADRALHTAGLGFDAAGWEIWPYLAAGATVVTCSQDDRLVADFIADQIADDRCTMAFVATAIAEELLTLDVDLPGLRVLLTGGDTLRLTAPVTGRYPLVNHYGPTEATVVTSAYTVTDADAVGSLPPIGVPISGVSVAVLGDDLRPVADGEPGELYVGGRNVAIGYLNEPELTRRRFVSLAGESGRWYRTGDLVSRRSGLLEFRGRVDRDQLKVRGVRVAAAEVEGSILAHPGIRAACATVVGHGTDSTLVAVIATNSEIAEDDLRRDLGTRLPSAVVPNRFLVVDQMPLTPNGKLDRAAVARLAGGGQPPQHP